MSGVNKNNKKTVIGKINTKKVFPNSNSVKVEEINMQEALNSRVKRNKGLYNKTNDSNSSNNVNNKQVEKKLSNTSQQKFNFDSKKIKIEDDMDNSFFKERKKKTKPKEKKPVSVKVEDISMKKAIKKGKNKNDSMVVTMLFLAVVIVFMGIFLIYHFGTFDHSKAKVKYKKVEIVPENIVFLGDSLTEFYDLKKYYPKRKVVNSGVGGNLTTDILDDMENRVYRYNPSHVILLIGINDLNPNPNPDDIAKNIKKIVKDIEINVPKAKIYLESIYPINYDKLVHSTPNPMYYKNNKNIKKINKNLKKFAKKEKITYINMYDELTDKNGDLELDYTRDGLHLNDKGYEIVTFKIKKILKKYY